MMARIRLPSRRHAGQEASHSAFMLGYEPLPLFGRLHSASSGLLGISHASRRAPRDAQHGHGLTMQHEGQESVGGEA